MQEHLIGIGHNGPPRDIVGPHWLRGVEARIYRREHPVTTAGRARAGEWILRFERRTQPYIEPLMGWTGGDDTLATEVEMTFPSLEQAVSYAERQGLIYRVAAGDGSQAGPCKAYVKSARRRHEPSDLPDVPLNADGDVIWLESARTSYGQCTLPMMTDLEQALVSPASVFRTPEDVVRDPLLSHYCKREILWRWAWDEYLVELAQGEGMIGESASRLDEVKTALLQLGDEWHPHPSAPAAFATRFAQAETALAA